MTSDKFILIAGFALVAFASCGKSEKQQTPQQIEHIADSIYQVKLRKLRQQAKEDYDKRLPIELKPKVDSILRNKLDAQPVPSFPDDEERGDSI